ncbi:MAG: Hsp20/alpha crystallin family protein, partial [Sweet potato little leaf phytoplasma]|nr:Hsp20/alpha crystallin family protein [Sweet potato little leaf phytoplasma]
LIMDLPGFTKEQVKISVNEGRLTIEADNRCEQTNNKQFFEEWGQSKGNEAKLELKDEFLGAFMYHFFP